LPPGNSQEECMSFENISVREAHEKQGRGYTYVDVRSVPEFEQGHPAGAVNVPLLHRDVRTGQMMANREFLDIMRANFSSDAKLLIGCQVGGRSAQAAESLVLAGFNDVANVLGGFGGARDPMTGAVRAEGWTQAALPVETGGGAGRSYEDLRAKLAQQGPVAE
jgi:rhodanese-related sulfurtransferase